MQLWCGIVVSIKPDAERRARSSCPVSAEHHAGSELKKGTKGTNRLPSSSDPDTPGCHVVKSGLGSGKGKRKKHLSTSPLLGAWSKRKHGMYVCVPDRRTCGLVGRDQCCVCIHVSLTGEPDFVWSCRQGPVLCVYMCVYVHAYACNLGSSAIVADLMYNIYCTNSFPVFLFKMLVGFRGNNLFVSEDKTDHGAKIGKS